MNRSARLLVLAVLALPAAGQMTGHYVNGVEGLKTATLPPPGLYYRNYLVFYQARRLTDGGGDALPVGLDLDVFATANRLIWISPHKILGGYYGCDAIVPFVQTDFALLGQGLRDAEFGLGDIWVEPITISWHGPRFDAVVGFGFYAPTGDFSATAPASPGKDFWTLMTTYGGTLYLDPARNWSASVLGRWEAHTRNTTLGITPGMNLDFEWGLARSFTELAHGPDGAPLPGPPLAIWDVGVSGYATLQVTDDSGPGVVYDASVHDRVFAVGPEVSVTLPGSRLMGHLRHQWEFGAVDRPEGWLTSFVLTAWW